MSSRRRRHHPILLALCVLVGGALGYSTSAPPPEATEPPQGALPSRTTAAATPSAILHREVSRSAAAETPAATAPPAGFPPLPPPGPIRAYLDELRERARLGDRTAARRAHRDLHSCAQARERLRPLRDAPKPARALCVAESLCAGLGAVELAEAGAFLMRAAELGDPDAMAAVADGQALDGTAAGIRRLPATRALASAYLQRALEAGSPIAMMALVTGLCPSADPLQSVFHHRDFPPEERLAWFHAIRPLLQNPQLRDSPSRCSEQWTAEAAARAEARGRALHAQHYAARRDLPALPEADWHRVRAELGWPQPHDRDSRWQDFPECSG